ncbi:MAG: hypothetical protein K2K80_06315, partial [Clostridia bacterium]|nr:hypothetical protein [Clostridia bacterium]
MKNRKNCNNREQLSIFKNKNEMGADMVNTKRRASKLRLALSCVLLAIAFVAAFFGFTNAFAPIQSISGEKEINTASATTVSDWETVAKSGGTFTLQEDWIATKFGTGSSNSTTYYYNGGGLLVKKNITIDLNGHILSRNLSSATKDGAVIYVIGGGVLTIKDSVGGGQITGGYGYTVTDSYKGGGIVASGSTSKVIIESGTITGNKTASQTEAGSAISMLSSSTLTMTGGTVSYNESVINYTAPIYIGSGAKANISNVQITNNTATKQYSSGGILVNSTATNGTTISNCIITDNTAEGHTAAAVLI